MPEKSRQAACAELREFLSQMRGKSPKEMLGAIASSNLVQSTMIATAAITATIIALTIIPFGWDKAFGKASASPQPATPAESADPGNPAAPAAEPDLDAASKADAAGKLGIGDAKDAPANINPLESSTDDLLKGLE